MQKGIRTSRTVIVALVIAAVVSVALIAGAVYYYFAVQVQFSPETPKVTWVTGSDIAATIGPNGTWCQISLSKLEPNVTTVYTNALQFTVNTASSGMAFQIASLTDGSGIIWGIRFHIFTLGVQSTGLTLVDGGNVTIGGTDGSAEIAAVGYRQSGASLGYGSASLPTQSSGFTGNMGTTYIIAVEVTGKDGILTTQTATMQLKLVWS